MFSWISLFALKRAYFSNACCYLVLGAAGRDNRSLLTSLIWASSVSVASASSPSCVCRLLMVCASSSSLRLELAAWRLYSRTMQPPPMTKMIASPSSSAPSSAAASSFKGLMVEPRKPMILIFVLISIQWYAMKKTCGTTWNYLTDLFQQFTVETLRFGFTFTLKGTNITHVHVLYKNCNIKNNNTKQKRQVY